MLSYEVTEWGKPLQKATHDTPKPTGTEVLLQLKYCGVCHSDVHIREGYFELGGGKRFYMTERGMKLPVTLGHEPYGTVIAAGPDAGDVPIGADRLVCPWIGCGTCARCREGQDNHCMAPRFVGVQRSGGYADHLLIPHPRYLVDASGVDPAWAATLSCSGLTTFSAVSKLKPIPRDEWVAVMGAGGLGLMAIDIAEEYGGQSGSFFQSILAIEELAKVDPAAAVIVDVQNTLCNTALQRWGNDEQKRRFLPRLAHETQVLENGVIRCFTFVETRR